MCWQPQVQNVSDATLLCVKMLPGFPEAPVLQADRAQPLVECLSRVLRDDDMCAGRSQGVAFVADECIRSARAWRDGMPAKQNTRNALKGWRSLERFLLCARYCSALLRARSASCKCSQPSWLQRATLPPRCSLRGCHGRIRAGWSRPSRLEL